MKKLENKTVFITGGLSGVGKVCAFAAANEGANLVIADLDSDAAKTTLKELKLINSQVVFIECDVSVPVQVQKAVQKVVSTFETPEAAFNNDRIGSASKKVISMSEHPWLRVITGFQLNEV